MDEFIRTLIAEVKSQGVFDEFRFNCCLADVDTKPAYQNVRTRVETAVNDFLAKQQWTPDTNKVQLRERLRKHLLDSEVLDKGVDQIVDQVVNPKVATIFEPKIESIVYKYLGITPPPPPPQRPAGPAGPLLPAPPLPPYAGHMNGSTLLRVETTAAGGVGLLPTDLEQISPDSDQATVKSELEKEESKDDDLPPGVEDERNYDEDTSPSYEPLSEEKPTSSKEMNNGLLNHSDSVNGVSQAASQLSQVSSDSRLTIASSTESVAEATQQATALVNNSTELTANISEEAQMPKFSENSSDASVAVAGEDNGSRQLHFDIKQDAITFEGTERRNSVSDTNGGVVLALSIEDAIMSEVKANIDDANHASIELEPVLQPPLPPLPKVAPELLVQPPAPPEVEPPPPPPPPEIKEEPAPPPPEIKEEPAPPPPEIKEEPAPPPPEIKEEPVQPPAPPEVKLQQPPAPPEVKLEQPPPPPELKPEASPKVEPPPTPPPTESSKPQESESPQVKTEPQEPQELPTGAAEEDKPKALAPPEEVEAPKEEIAKPSESTASPTSKSSSRDKDKDKEKDKERRNHSHSDDKQRRRSKDRDRERDRDRSRDKSHSKHSSSSSSKHSSSHSSSSKHRSSSSSSKNDKSSTTSSSSKSHRESSSSSTKRTSSTSSSRHESSTSSSSHKKHKSSSSSSRSDRDKEKEGGHNRSHHSNNSSSSSSSKRKDQERSRDRDRHKSNSATTAPAPIQDDHNESKAKLDKRRDSDSNDDGKPPSSGGGPPKSSQTEAISVEKPADESVENGNGNGTNGNSNGGTGSGSGSNGACDSLSVSGLVIVSDLLQQSSRSFIELTAGCQSQKVAVTEDSIRKPQMDEETVDQTEEMATQEDGSSGEPQIADEAVSVPDSPIEERRGGSPSGEGLEEQPAEVEGPQVEAEKPQVEVEEPQVDLDPAETETSATAEGGSLPEDAQEEAVKPENLPAPIPRDSQVPIPRADDDPPSDELTHFEENTDEFRDRLQLINILIEDSEQLLSQLSADQAHIRAIRRSISKRRWSSHQEQQEQQADPEQQEIGRESTPPPSLFGSPGSSPTKRLRREEPKSSPTPSEASVNSKENEALEKQEHDALNARRFSQKLCQQQRYTNDDLYKPRPILSQRSRRRGLDSIL